MSSEIVKKAYSNNLEVMQDEQSMKDFAQRLIDNKLIPQTYESPESAVIALQQAKELQIPPMTMLQHSFIIEGTGKIGYDVHLFGLLARENNVSWALTHDYEYRMKDGSYKEVLPKEIQDEISQLQADLKSQGKESDEIKREAIKLKNSYIDTIVTEIMFYEIFNGETLKRPFKYTWSAAKRANLTTKFNWKNMPDLMMRTRCLTQGLRFYVPELFKGIYEHTEVMEMSDKNFQVKDNGAGFAEVYQEEN